MWDARAVGFFDDVPPPPAPDEPPRYRPPAWIGPPDNMVSRLTDLGPSPFRATADGPPTAPVLIARGGYGGSGCWRQDFWLWPLPSAGPLALVMEWPAEGVPETRVELSADDLGAAAERAIELWPDDRPEPPPDGPACFAR